MTTTTDLIDELAGIRPGSSLDDLRRRRPETRDNTQASYLALFEPEFPATVNATERFAIATFVAGVHEHDEIQRWYADRLDDVSEPTGIPRAIAAEIVAGLTTGPYGRYPQSPLQGENADGLVFRVSEAHRASLGSRITAALEHAHLLVFRPRESSREELDTLLRAGWSVTDIVTLSQLVAFLSFQIRVASGLRTLGDATVAASPEKSPR